MRSHLNITGELLIGIEYKGVVHKHFELQPVRVRDTIEAEKATVGKSTVEFMIAILAKQIVKLGAVPEDAITVDLLCEMYDDDLEVFQKARDGLKKKLMESAKEQKTLD